MKDTETKKIYSSIYGECYIHFEEKIHGAECSRCGKRLKRGYIIQDDECMEIAYYGTECIKELK